MGSQRRPLDRHRPRRRRIAGRAAGDRRRKRANGSVARLPAAYVSEHVELGYAITAHRAQGMTVDATFTILRPGMSRELAYVAMTRGRTENHAFIATDIPELGYDGAPAPEQTGRQVMAQIIANAGAQVSATQTLRALQDDATSLAQLAPIHETLVQSAQHQWWTSVIKSSGLTDGLFVQVETSPAYGPLVAALRRAENDGHPIQRVLPALIAAAPLDGGSHPDDGAPARDLAAVLHRRVTTWHESTSPAPGHPSRPLIGGMIAPAGHLGPEGPADQRAAIEQLETLMTRRVDSLTQQVLENQPSWLRALGAPPADPRRRTTWTAAVGLVASYRDRYQLPDHGHPLGDPEPADPNQRLARRRALAASRATRTTGASRPITQSPAPHATRNSPSL